MPVRHVIRHQLITAAGAAFTPASLTGLVAWYDASDTATITASSNRVSQIDDKSGNGRHLKQSTGANQPQSGLTTINSLNVVKFDDSARVMDTDTISVSTTAFSQFLVMSFHAAGSHGNAIGGWSSYTPYGSSNSNFQFYDVPGGAADTATINLVTPPSFSEPLLFNFIVTAGVGAASRLIGSGEDLTGSRSYTPSSATMTGIRHGQEQTGGRGGTQYLCERVICSATISGSDLTNMITYATAKWGIA